jgi:hypothetical protein
VKDVVSRGVGIVERNSVDNITMKWQGQNFRLPRKHIQTHVAIRILDSAKMAIVLVDIIATVKSAGKIKY